MDARDQNGPGTIDVIVIFFNIMYLPLAGRTMRPTARRNCLPLRESLVLEDNLMHSTLTLSVGSPTLSRWERVSLNGPSSTSQFVAKALFPANAYSTSQFNNNWSETNAIIIGGNNFSPLFPCRSHSHARFTSHSQPRARSWHDTWPGWLRVIFFFDWTQYILSTDVSLKLPSHCF